MCLCGEGMKVDVPGTDQAAEEMEEDTDAAPVEYEGHAGG